MKYGKKYIFAACAVLLLGMQACDLDEYNPAGSTPDNVYKEQAGFEALVNSAYAFWGGQFYGREDFVLLLNGGAIYGSILQTAATGARCPSMKNLIQRQDR
ncbi:MAG: hypothetical protein LUI85_08045 [Bacteroides sp.]|nr:hypothetical protein [Bacteroides sp.]